MHATKLSFFPFSFKMSFHNYCLAYRFIILCLEESVTSNFSPTDRTVSPAFQCGSRCEVCASCTEYASSLGQCCQTCTAAPGSWQSVSLCAAGYTSQQYRVFHTSRYHIYFSEIIVLGC